MSKIAELLRVSDAEIELVRKIYGKCAEDVQENVNILLEWANKQPHLPKPHDKIRLERFLLRNKFRIEQTKSKQGNYYTFRLLHPEFYRHVDPESDAIQTVMKCFILAPMPALSPRLERVIITRFVENLEDDFNFLHMVGYMFMTWELQLSHDYSAGDVYVLDCSSLTLKHIFKMDAVEFHRAFQLFQQAFSGRLSGLDFVNLPPFFNLLLNLLKLVLDSKVFGKVRLHGNLESLHEVVPKECLPEELGGDLESYQTISGRWNEELIAQKDFLAANAERVSNESLRIGEPIRNDLFGMNGTFRTIRLD